MYRITCISNITIIYVLSLSSVVNTVLFKDCVGHVNKIYPFCVDL